MRRRFEVPALAGTLLALLLALGGCATPQLTALKAEPPAGMAPHAEIRSTPFFPQTAYHCGPASLATVLNFAGVNTTPQALADEVYVPERKGALQAEMLAAVRRHGLVAYPLRPRLDDLLREVAAGTPVVVLENLSLPIFPMWHYAVVIGYDLPREAIVLRSGTTRREVMALGTFEHTWARSGHWAMVAVAPQYLPLTANEDDYVAAVVALEHVAPKAARQAYATAIKRWPKNRVALLGLGNTAYRMHDLAAAEDAYRRATAAHPQSADAWNNLAQTLSDLGRKDEALDAGRRAVTLGGPRLALYRATLKTIAEAR